MNFNNTWIMLSYSFDFQVIFNVFFRCLLQIRRQELQRTRSPHSLSKRALVELQGKDTVFEPVLPMKIPVFCFMFSSVRNEGKCFCTVKNIYFIHSCADISEKKNSLGTTQILIIILKQLNEHKAPV